MKKVMRMSNYKDTEKEMAERIIIAFLTLLEGFEKFFWNGNIF